MTLRNALSSPDLSLFRYVVFGLARCSGEVFLAQPEPVGWALAALMSRGKASRPAYKLACQKRILTARLTGARRTALLDFVEAYLELTPSETTEYKILSRRNRRGTRAMWMTWSEKQKAAGREEGLRLGKREGLKEGKSEGIRSLQQVLLRQLDQRFGPLPETVQDQVEAISSLRRLTRLAQQVLVVSSLRELRLR